MRLNSSSNTVVLNLDCTFTSPEELLKVTISRSYPQGFWYWPGYGQVTGIFKRFPDGSKCSQIPGPLWRQCCIVIQNAGLRSLLKLDSKRNEEERGNFCWWSWKLECSPGKQKWWLRKWWGQKRGNEPWHLLDQTVLGPGRWLWNWSKLKKRCLPRGGKTNSEALLAVSCRLGPQGWGALPPCPLTPLAPAFSTWCHLPEVHRLKKGLGLHQAAGGQEVAFGSSLIRGGNTAASPNWFSDSKW